jgi:hypothetical protein
MNPRVYNPRDRSTLAAVAKPLLLGQYKRAILSDC